MNSGVPVDVAKMLDSLSVVETNPVAFMACVYQNLFDRLPAAKLLFEKVRMDEQGKMVLSVFRFVLENMHDEDGLNAVLKGLGKRHLLYGVKPHYYVELGNAFVDALEEFLGDSYNESLAADWTWLAATLTGLMVKGARSNDEILHDKGFYQPIKLTEGQYLARFSKSEGANEALAANPVKPVTKRTIKVDYLGEKIVSTGPMQTILDISLGNDIPHICECKGTARCSTCRVLIVEGLENCLPPSSLERQLSDRKGFPDDIRLACQTRVVGDVTVKRLVKDKLDAKSAISETLGGFGHEIEGAVLFTDIWNFTTFSENNLPYDVIHALNRLFNVLGNVIDKHNGYVDKYIGDCVMALFGLEEDCAKTTCRNAIEAALEINESLEGVNYYLQQHLGSSFRLGVGVAFGKMVVGELGFKLKRQFTAIGDTINVAARLERETRKVNANLLISDSMAVHLDCVKYELFNSCSFSLKGKNEKVVAHQVRRR